MNKPKTYFFNSEDKEAELRLFEEYRREFIDELISSAQEVQIEPLDEEQIEECIRYADECQNNLFKAIQRRIDELKIINGN